VSGIRFGSTEANTWGLDPLNGILASGSTCITVPDVYYSWVLEILVNEFGMSYSSNLGEQIFLTSCVNQFTLPKLYFLVGSYWYQADPTDYVYVLDEKCFVCI
jgi:hypothetical protein